jgi:hypothetical protein
LINKYKKYYFLCKEDRKKSKEAKLQETKFIMRTIINQQKQFGEIEIASIEFDPKSRDDIPQILRGLQHIYTNPSLTDKSF